MGVLETVDIAALELVKYPDPRLREPCGAVEVFDERLRALAEKMFAVMYERGGVGLAAPQVGVALRLFVASPAPDGSRERVYVNPVILDNQGRQDGEEGCLSVPRIFCQIRRYSLTTLRAQDLEGREFTETAEGLTARAFQHELDHLEGRLILDRMSVAARLANRRAIKDLEEGAGD